MMTTTEEFLEAADRLNEEFQKISIAWEQLGELIGKAIAAFIDAFGSAVDAIQDFTIEISELRKPAQHSIKRDYWVRKEPRNFHSAMLSHSKHLPYERRLY